MVKVTYNLKNGTKVNTLAEAKISGQQYSVTYEEIPKEPVKLTEKQKANRIKI